jgi:hypothetical protein
MCPAFGSNGDANSVQEPTPSPARRKTLHANPGDHRRVRWVGLDDAFLSRHLGRVRGHDSAETVQ